jgi:hypothetical protein
MASRLLSRIASSDRERRITQGVEAAAPCSELNTFQVANPNANDPSSPHANGTFRALDADQGLTPPATIGTDAPPIQPASGGDGHGSSHWPLPALPEMGSHDALLQVSLEQRLPADTDSYCCDLYRRFEV